MTKKILPEKTLAKKTSAKKTTRPSVLVEVLEPRFMMSADVPGADILVPAEDVQDLSTEGDALVENAQTQYENVQDTPPQDSTQDALDSTVSVEPTTSTQSTTSTQVNETQESDTLNTPLEADVEPVDSAAQSNVPHEDSESQDASSTDDTDVEPSVESETSNETEPLLEADDVLDDNAELTDTPEESLHTDLSANDADVEDAALLETTNTEETRTELVFVNDNVTDYQALMDGIAPSDESRTIEIVVLDATLNGIEQVSEALSERTDLDAIHIISYGADGVFSLGEDWIDNDELLLQRDAIALWGMALSDDADILLYGCNVAEDGDGELLSHTLAELTGADVATSDDITGTESLGGDWDLEYQTGLIETRIAITQNTQLNWNGVLDVTTGLVGHWTLDSDGSDSSSNGLDGTLGGNATIDTSIANQNIGAGNLALDGDDDYLDLSTHAATFNGMTEGTIAGWIQTTDTTNLQTLFGVNDQSDVLSFGTLGVYQGNVSFSLSEVSSGFDAYLVDVESTAFVADGNWHHIAVTVDGTGNALYVDGAKIDAADLTYLYGDETSSNFFDDVLDIDSVNIGVTGELGGYAYDTNGSIDDVRVYDRALTEA